MSQVCRFSILCLLCRLTVRGADFADVSIEKGGRDDQRRTHDEIGRHDKVKEVHLHTQTDVCMYVYAYSCVYMYMHM